MARLKRPVRSALSSVATLAVLVLLPAAIACRGTNGAGALGPDAGALPDANVVAFMDGGVADAAVPPSLRSVLPASGSEVGGTRVTLRGRGFSEPARVELDGVAASEVTVLDPSSIAAVTPPHAPGPVGVAVTTPHGTSTLAAAFVYARDLQLLAVEPPRIPDVGGAPVTVTGRGFDANTIVLFGRKPLAGVVVADAEHLTGFTPSLPPGRPAVLAAHADAAVTRGDLVVVLGSPRIDTVRPGYGPTTGGSTQAVAGAGLTLAARVRFGDTPGAALTLVSDGQLTVRSPTLVAGHHDVTVENADARGVLPAGFVAYDPAETRLSLAGVVPAATSTSGGVVTLVGSGLLGDAAVTVGGAPARVVSADLPHAIAVLVPPGLAPGVQPIVLRQAALAATATVPGGLEIIAPITVTGISPGAGPTAGGTAVTIRGKGFIPGASARIGDVPLAVVNVVSPQEIQAVTVAGAYGPADVVVAGPRAEGVLRGGFAFDEPLAILRMDPAEGSIAGNTYVSVLGRGLAPPVSVTFGGTPGIGAALENGSVLGVRTASAPPGQVDVAVHTGRGDAGFPGGFRFFDPRLLTGGAFGGPIVGAVNVAVVDPGSGSPIPGMLVQLGYDADPRLARRTDANGLATISSPDVLGPQAVTAGQSGFEFVTFLDLDAQNLTLFASPYPQSMPAGAPTPPCPGSAQAPMVSGHVYKLKSTLDPATHPGWTAQARVTYTQSDVFSPNPGSPPDQTAVVTSDGGGYQIEVLRAGTIAVYAILGDFNPQTQEFIPRALGIARQVPVNPNKATTGVDIAVDIPLSRTATAVLLEAPPQLPGPTAGAVLPFLNLGSEGVIPFDSTIISGGPVVLPGLPALAASDFFYLGGSFTSVQGILTAPFAVALAESGAPLEQGVQIGPFVQMPVNPSPRSGEVLHDGRLSWDQGGPEPDLTIVHVSDVTKVTGCCCVDLNMDGSCEAIEPAMCATVAQGFNRWSIYGPGGRDAYVMPAMPPGVQALDLPASYGWTVQQALSPRFDYREFVYGAFSPPFWQSWSLWSSDFVAKEETR